MCIRRPIIFTPVSALNNPRIPKQLPLKGFRPPSPPPPSACTAMLCRFISLCVCLSNGSWGKHPTIGGSGGHLCDKFGRGEPHRAGLPAGCQDRIHYCGNGTPVGSGGCRLTLHTQHYCNQRLHMNLAGKWQYSPIHGDHCQDPCHSAAPKSSRVRESTATHTNQTPASFLSVSFLERFMIKSLLLLLLLLLLAQQCVPRTPHHKDPTTVEISGTHRGCGLRDPLKTQGPF